MLISYVKYLNALCFEMGFFIAKHCFFKLPRSPIGSAKAGYKDRNKKPITKWFMKYIITFDARVSLHFAPYFKLRIIAF
ncbi:hypothetical protein SAMN05421827_13020 [Pedobacter terrae]|uniref:Uncharacterized protein n=1 Tax=Pedobacter terrae TaxID=405671 RepID=A0A1G8DMC3_9SPHI|nr:hypothetical protein SAMN05421827_13020 [Pedobacter terrae]